MVDGTGLENRQVSSFAGSNPVPSARRLFCETFKCGTVAQMVRAWDS